MEGDPRARIAPWGSSEDRAAHSEALHSSASPEAQQQAQDAQPSSRSAPAQEEGMQAPGWGDVGDFSMGTLDAPSIAAVDQSGKAEQQQHYSHRSAMTPHYFTCKGRARILWGLIVEDAHGHDCAGFAEQRRGGRGGTSIRGLKAAQRSCKITLTSDGRGRQHDEHVGAAFFTCIVGTFLRIYSDSLHMTKRWVSI